MKVIEKEFIDDKGEPAKVVIESCNSYQVNMGKQNYKLAESMRPKKNFFSRRFKKESIFNTDIGIKSHGFAPIATLAVIIAIAGVIFAYLMFRF